MAPLTHLRVRNESFQCDDSVCAMWRAGRREFGEIMKLLNLLLNSLAFLH